MDVKREIASTLQRIARTREIADELRHDERLHRLSMETVFVLEDMLFTLRQMAGEENGKSPPPDVDAP